MTSDQDLCKKSNPRRKDSRNKCQTDKWETSTDTSETGGCNWSFVFDPAGRLCYYWSLIVSFAFLYNFWVLIYRSSFREINSDTIFFWFSLDYIADLLYVGDIMFHFRTGYLEEGVLQTDTTKLRNHYMNSTKFYVDCLCLLPLDFLYLSIGFNSMLRCFRLVKIYRFWAFLDRTERHTNYPNLFRSFSLLHYLLALFHWDASLYHLLAKQYTFSDKWRDQIVESNEKDLQHAYLKSLYWCTMILTTIGNVPQEPSITSEYIFLLFQLTLGLLVFAAVLGYVGNIVTNISTARKEFQGKLGLHFQFIIPI